MQTNLMIILDKSGSMGMVREATISGLNEYIGSLAKDGNHYHVTLTLFDTEVTRPWEDLVLSDKLVITRDLYSPNGNTALYDAVCSTLNRLKPVEDSKNIVVIMTDGDENSSKEYNERDMKRLVDERQKLGNYTFVFMGANQDAYAEAAKYNISRGNTVTFNATARGVGSTFSAMSANTSRTASAASMSTSDFYSAKQQADIEEAK